MISSANTFTKDVLFSDDFKNESRFSVQDGDGIFHLNISALKQSDSATYYCWLVGYKVELKAGVTLRVEGPGSLIQAVVQQPVWESVQPGDSVTLTCTVHSVTRDGEYRVHWFRRSGESQPGLIYTHRNQCQEDGDNKSTLQRCVYSLPVEKISSSDAGTYYCAVASCGEILFGNGTKLETNRKYEEGRN